MHAADLDPAVRAQLRSLPESIADNVARHLVMADRIFADDPERGYQYAVAAREIASRVAAVRAFCGVAAYRTGRWADALSELRAARRMSGEDTYLPLMADAERGLGRPERAMDLARSPEADRLDRADRIELRIVESGARRDLGQYDAAVVALQVPELKDPQRRPWTARLYYAYADALLDAGREDDARLWFARAAEADRTGETDAHERFTALEGADVFDVETDEIDILDAESDAPIDQPQADDNAGATDSPQEPSPPEATERRTGTEPADDIHPPEPTDEPSEDAPTGTPVESESPGYPSADEPADPPPADRPHPNETGPGPAEDEPTEGSVESESPSHEPVDGVSADASQPDEPGAGRTETESPAHAPEADAEADDPTAG